VALAMCQDATIDRRQDIISRKNNKSEIIPGIKKKKRLILERSKSQSLELLCKQERHACKLLMGAVHSMRFIALSTRLSAINNTVVDGPSKSGGHLWESRVGMTMFRTISNAEKVFEVSHKTLNEK